MDKGLGSAQNFTPIDGWKRGDLDFFTIDQGWDDYTDEQHEVWSTLYKRQLEVLPGRAIDTFMDSLNTLGISQDGIPKFEEINEILMERTGWQVVGVPGLIPDEPFFELLANRRFPSGTFIRGKNQLDYIQEPDVFHDVFGHVPMLADPVFGDYMEAYGRGGLKAAGLGAIDMIARLYWYTVEFGLIQEEDGLRIFGAGILSSPTETVFSVESDSPHRIRFDLKRILRTHYQIDDFQDNYFVIDSFEQLFEETHQDFTPIYEEVAKLPIIQPGELAEGDDVVTKGTGEYAIEADRKREERARAQESGAA